MKRLYRGWWVSTIDKETYQAVKGCNRIIGTYDQIQREIDRRALEDLRKEQNNDK